MSELLLTASTGREAGTRSSRRLRREGRIPAIVYGLGAEPVSVSVEWTALRRALTTDAGLNALITLSIDGEEQLSIIKDIQRHPVRRDVLHVDFIRIDPTASITVEVPLILVGEALEVTQASGMVDQNMFTLTVNTSPSDIPDEIRLDISELTVGEALHVADIPLPPGVTTDVDPEEAVASAVVTRSTLEAMRAEEEAEAAEDEEGVEGEEGAEGEDGAEGDAGDDGGDDS